jgi:hypothetical protein
MGQQYRLQVINNSTNPGNICVYQSLPESMGTDWNSLAWFSQYAYPSTTVTFAWALNYQFMCGETGSLKPGVVFGASQALDADLTTQNMVALHYDHALTFTSQTMNPESAGSLVVTQHDGIPLNLASVGIGISGAAAFALQAQPNSTLIFTPDPTYWLTFGTYQKGEILDTPELSDSVKVEFPPNVFAMTAILNPDNTWTVRPTGTV